MTHPLISLSLSESSAWILRARCGDEGAAYMFPDESDAVGVELAKSECRVCPVQTQCLKRAIDTGERWGVWGGFTPEERRNIARGMRRAGDTSPGSVRVATAASIVRSERRAA